MFAAEIVAAYPDKHAILSHWTNETIKLSHPTKRLIGHAAEIAETYRDKHVTLVQSGKVLVPGYGARFSRLILKILRDLNVQVVTPSNLLC